MADIPRTCPHCESRLSKWRVPEESTWTEEFFWVCFNDDCPYYKQGWDWMKQHYGQHASYRYAISPAKGASSMIPVWSETATREMIVEDAVGGDQ